MLPASGSFHRLVILKTIRLPLTMLRGLALLIVGSTALSMAQMIATRLISITKPELGCYITQIDLNGTLSWNTSKYVSISDFNTGVDWRFTQLADINGDGLPDACGRFTDGIRCYLNTSSTSTFSFNPTPIKDTYWSDANGWNASNNSVGIIDINSDNFPDICGRNASGLLCHLNASGVSFSTTSSYTNSGVSDTNLAILVFPVGRVGGCGGNPCRYSMGIESTLRYADVNQDNRLDLCSFVGVSAGYGTDFQVPYKCWLNNGSAFGSAISTGITYTVNAYSNDANLLRNLFITAIDLNQDGRPDMCLRKASGMACWINTQDASGNPNMVSTSISGLTNLFPSSGGWDADQYLKTIQFTDLNSDGRPDLCARGASGMQCYINTSSSISPYFSFQSVTTGFSGSLSDSAGFGNANIYPGIRFFTLANGRTALFTRQNSSPSLVRTMGSLAGTEAIDLLTVVSAGGAPNIDITYGNGAITSGLYTKRSNASSMVKADYRAVDLPAPMPVVSKVSMTQPDGFSGSSTSYQYEGLVAQAKRGVLGFGQVTSSILPANAWVRTTYRQDWPFTGMAASTITGNANLAAIPSWPLSQTVNYYTAIDLSNGLNTVNNPSPNTPSVTNGCGTIVPKTVNLQAVQGRYLVYPHEVEQNAYSANTASTPLSQVITDTVMETTQGNVTCTSVKTRDKLDTSKVWEKVTTNNYDTSAAWTAKTSGSAYSSTDLWILGRLTSSSVKSKAPTSAFTTTPVLGASQGGYSQVVLKPNDLMGNQAPVYPDIMGWFIPVSMLLR